MTKVRTPAGSVEPGMVCVYHYSCMATEEEVGSFQGFFIGKIDTWGKLVIRDVNSQDVYYLFPREITRIEQIYG